MSSNSSPPHSPPPESPSRGPRCLDQLPNELLRFIFDHLTPSPFSAPRYWEQQQNFLSLSLVSRRFTALAQEYLNDIVKVDDTNIDWIYEKLSSDNLTRRWKPKTIVISHLDSSKLDRINNLGPLLKDVEQLFYSCRGDSTTWQVEHARLQACSGFYLRRLVLKSMRLPTAGAPIEFPLLEEFILKWVSFPANDPKIRLPRLRHYSTSDLQSSSTVERSLIISLEPQLRSLSILAMNETILTSSILQSPTVSTIVHALISEHWVLFYARHRSIIKHLHLVPSNLPPPVDDVKAWITEFEQQHRESTALEAIYLSIQLHSEYTSDWPAGPRDEMERLVTSLESRGIEIVWKGTTWDCLREYFFLPEFARRAELDR
ncbi:hypothetical protein JCM3765_002590 [Sporobolomyces pararoseus]